MSPFPGYRNVTRETTPAVPMHLTIWMHERCGALILLPPQHDEVCYEPGSYWKEHWSQEMLNQAQDEAYRTPPEPPLFKLTPEGKPQEFTDDQGNGTGVWWVQVVSPQEQPAEQHGDKKTGREGTSDVHSDQPGDERT